MKTIPSGVITDLEVTALAGIKVLGALLFAANRMSLAAPRASLMMVGVSMFGTEEPLVGGLFLLHGVCPFTG